MSPGPSNLVCFAVKEEAKFFRPIAALSPNIQILITGMGQGNAERSVRTTLADRRPELVLSCGFAGGLNPALASGMIVFTAKGLPHLESVLVDAGARSAQFHCTSRVATTVTEKRSIHSATGADAVEMESQVIQSVCLEQQIPCAIVRVILDTANEDLPLDFNAMMNAKLEMDYGKLALTLFKSPGKVPALLRLQKQTEAAAKKLSRILIRITAELQPVIQGGTEG